MAIDKITIKGGLKVQGTLGELFTVDDTYTGVIHSIADISGVPIFRVEDTGYSYFNGRVEGLYPVGNNELATKKYVDDNSSGGVPEAPTDGTTYGRNNAAWVATSGGGGTVTEVTTGTGLSVTNGTTTPNVTVNLSAFAGVDGSGLVASTDYFVILDGSAERKILFQNVKNSWFSNDAGWTTNTGDVTLAGAQTLTGKKTFNAGIGIGTSDLITSSGNNIEVYDGATANMIFTAGHANANLQVFKFITGSTEQLEIAGDTGIDMTGALAVSVPTPTASAHATTKTYVDNLTQSKYLRADVADTQAGGIIFSSGAGTFNDNVELRFGTSGAESEIFSNGSETLWKIKNNNIQFRNNSDTTARLTITQTGALTSLSDFTAVGFYETSDRNLKENIIPLDERYYAFNFKGDERQRYGVIAQELEKTHSELVKKDGETLSVNYIDLLCLEIVELKERIKTLEDGQG